MSKYFHGHHESVLKVHSRRLVADSAAYLLPYLKPNFSILDVGCGPASITVDFALNYVNEGQVTGLETTDEILKVAEEHAQENHAKNVDFVKGSVLELPFEDNSFDVVHAHQVLQHLQDPVLALKEMARVAKPGGFVASRDADYRAFYWYPESAAMSKWIDTYLKSAKALNAEPCAGRRYRKWALEAGLKDEQLTFSSGNYTWASPENVAWWSNLWKERALLSSFATTSKEYGLATDEDLKEISEGWEAWGKEPDAFFGVVHSELLYSK